MLVFSMRKYLDNSETGRRIYQVSHIKFLEVLDGSPVTIREDGKMFITRNNIKFEVYEKWCKEEE